jgi:hypothetical protein
MPSAMPGAMPGEVSGPCSMRIDINRPGASASRAGPSSTDVHTFFGLEGPLAVLLSALRVTPHPPGATEVTRCAPTSGLPQQLIPRAAGWGEAARRADARHASASDDRGGRRSAAHTSSATVASTVRPSCRRATHAVLLLSNRQSCACNAPASVGVAEPKPAANANKVAMDWELEHPPRKGEAGPGLFARHVLGGGPADDLSRPHYSASQLCFRDSSCRCSPNVFVPGLSCCCRCRESLTLCMPAGPPPPAPSSDSINLWLSSPADTRVQTSIASPGPLRSLQGQVMELPQAIDKVTVWNQEAGRANATGSRRPSRGDYDKLEPVAERNKSSTSSLAQVCESVSCEEILFVVILVMPAKYCRRFLARSRRNYP